MAEMTKNAIRSAFLTLLNRKPLKQISVRDIVDECGINRNTFYYHYRDIPSLMETIILEEADRLVDQFPHIRSVEECVNAVVRFTLENRSAVLHIYRSVNRDAYEQYLWKTCEYVASRYLDELLKDRRISDTDRRIIIEYLKSLVFGLVINWLDQGMQEDIFGFVHRLCVLRRGELERMISRCISGRSGADGPISP